MKRASVNTIHRPKTLKFIISLFAVERQEEDAQPVNLSHPACRRHTIGAGTIYPGPVFFFSILSNVLIHLKTGYPCAIHHDPDTIRFLTVINHVRPGKNTRTRAGKKSNPARPFSSLLSSSFWRSRCLHFLLLGDRKLDHRLAPESERTGTPPPPPRCSPGAVAEPDQAGVELPFPQEGDADARA